MKYRIKCYLGGQVGWLFIVDENHEPRLYTLEQAIETANQYTHNSKSYVEIVDEDGESYENW